MPRNSSGGTGFPTWTQRVVAHLLANPDSPALFSVTSDGVDSWTRGELTSMTSGATDILDGHGVAEGDLVPALLSNRPMSVAMLLAGALSNRPLAPLAPRLTRRELLACVERIPGGILVTEPEWLDMATDLADATGKRVCVVAEPAFGSAPLTARSDPDGVAFVMHTSGTTGLPKQIWVREAPLSHRAEVNGELLQLDSDSRFVTAALFHHVAAIGNVAASLANGSALVMFPAFSVDAWRALEAAAPTHTVLVVSVIEALLRADALALPSFRVIGYGASPIHPDTLRRVLGLLPNVDFVNLFGQTEGSPLTVLTPDDHREAIAGREELLKSVGRAAPGVELQIHEAGPDGVGEIWARCGHSFVVDDHGWQRTGDMARLVDGYVYLAGRRGDKIIRGGENVFPLEVENLLADHPDIVEASVVGVDDAEFGKRLAAYVVSRPESALDADAVKSHVRAQLARHKIPRDVVFLEQLPRNETGKVLRRQLTGK
jgi:acyl-CoA synthetase (AMP-forming)/AMP-acid ligase II